MELPKVTLNTDLNEGFCFGCGVNNPVGLKLKFTREGDSIRAGYTPDRYFQGWPGLLHGGLTATLIVSMITWWSNWREEHPGKGK